LKSVITKGVWYNIIMLFACLAIGMALRQSKRVPDNAHTAIKAFIVRVSLPALTSSCQHPVQDRRTGGRLSLTIPRYGEHLG